MDFLVKYTARHFSDEETFQLRHNYPKYKQHKQLHDDFRIVISNLAERLVQEGVSVSLTLEVGNIVNDWLVNHIKKEDFKMVRHARN